MYYLIIVLFHFNQVQFSLGLTTTIRKITALLKQYFIQSPKHIKQTLIYYFEDNKLRTLRGDALFCYL